MEALDDLLAWLAEGAVRLKALLADTAGGVGAAADSWAVPPGIMPPFPEKSSFGPVGGEEWWRWWGPWVGVGVCEEGLPAFSRGGDPDWVAGGKGGKGMMCHLWWVPPAHTLSGANVTC